MVYPIRAQYRYQDREKQRLHPKTSQRELYYGYIRSRSTAQFLTTDVQPTESRIEISQAADGQPQAVNQLGVEVKHAWIVDGEGKIWYAMDGASDSQLDLEPMDNNDAQKLLKKILADNRPEPPEGLDSARSYGFGGMRGTLSAVSPYADTALLNSEMANSASALLKGTPHTYIAITLEAPPFIAQGFSAQQEAGFHVVRGSYSP